MKILSKMKINKILLPMKGHFFLFNAGTAPLVPYLSTYARQLGFTSSTVGLIYTILPICGLVAKPLFGAIADRYKLQKVLFLLFQIVTAISFLGIYFIPDSPTDINTQIGCRNNETIVQGCYQNKDLIDNCQVTRLQSDATNTMCNFDCDSSLLRICNNCLDNSKLKSFVRDRTNTDNLEDIYLSSDKTIIKGFYLNEALGNLPSNSSRITVSGLISHSSIKVFSECVTFKLFLEDGTQILSKCNINETEFANCRLTFCNGSEVRELFQAASESHNEERTQFTSQFWLFFLLMIVSWVGQAVVVSVADAICFNLLGEKPQNYGRQRLWGSVGWGLFSLLTGFLIDAFSHGSNKDYTVAFILMFIFMSLDVVDSCFIQNKASKTSPSILADIGSLLTSLSTIVFFLWTIAVGLCTAMVWQFLFWHIEDVSRITCEESTKTLQGLVSAIQSFCGEIPFMFLSGTILKKLGHANMMSLVLFAFGIRFVLYSLLTNPWWFLPIEMLQGVTFGMFYPTMTSYASIVSPPGTETTVQGLTGAIFEGVGTSLGSFLGGRLYERYGGGNTFLWYGYGSFICCGIHVAIQYLLSRRRKFGNEFTPADKSEEITS